MYYKALPSDAKNRLDLDFTQMGDVNYFSQIVTIAITITITI